MNTNRHAEANRLFSTGLAHHQQGNFEIARQCYERGLALMPGNADARFLLGQLLFETGRTEEGEAMMRKAIAANPGAANYHRGLGVQLFNAGRLAAAAAAYRDAARLQPDDPENRFGLALVLDNQGDTAAAIAEYRNLLGLAPTHPEGLRLLALALVRTAAHTDALAAVDTLLASHPADASAWVLRADIHRRLGQAEIALGDLVQAATLAPGDAVLRTNLGIALMQAGLQAEGLEQLDQALQLAPDNADIHFNRGVALAKAGFEQQAGAAYEQALRLDPVATPALLNLANLYAGARRFGDARQLYERALALAPQSASAHFNLAMLHLDEGRRLDAAAELEAAHALAPGDGLIAAHLLFQSLHLCRWERTADLFPVVEAAIRDDSADIPPFITLAVPQTTPQLQARCAANHSRRLPAPAAVPARPERAAGKLRVGYLSSDFKEHATAYLMIEMLEAHDHERFEIVALSYGIDDGGPMRRRIAAAADRFVDLAGLPPQAAVAAIAAENCDILVDLKGYTEGSRSEWLKTRLAPVQVAWLGYPGTMAAPWIDCLIADRHVIPEENRPLYSERVVHLPDCYQPNARSRACGPAPSRAEAGLPEDAVVLCSFNQTYKITPEIFALWLEILKNAPAAVLWLWASNPWAETELRRLAGEAGVAPERLVFADGKPQAEHLARLALADLALDTFPCNGHTTTSDALWAGVPVVTLGGEAFAERVAGSLLAASGLSELIADTPDDYLRIVLDLCKDLPRLRDCRVRTAQLRERGILFDSVRFVRNFEAVLAAMWAQRLTAPAPSGAD